MTQEIFDKYVDEAYAEFEQALGYAPMVARDQITLSSRMKRSLGITYRHASGTYQVKINTILDDKLHPDRIKEIILHELLHTCPDCMNHGRSWKNHAARVMYYFPQYHISRLAKVKNYATCRYKCKHCGIKQYAYSSKKTKVYCPYCGRKMKTKKVNREETRE